MTLAEVVALEHARNRHARAEAQDVREREAREPFAVAVDLRTRGIEDLEDLVRVRARVRLDLGRGEDGTGRRAPARIADERREVADDQHRLVPELLELAQLEEGNRVPEVDVRRGRINA